MKKKLFVALYVTGLVLALVILNLVVTTIQSSPSKIVSAEEAADKSLAQYPERLNSTKALKEMTIPFYLRPFASARAETLLPDCSLRLSFAPVRKAVDSGETIDYVVTFTNKGKDSCKNVSFSAYYTDNEHYVTSTPQPTASDYFWSIGDLGSNKTFVINLTTKTTYKNGEQMITEACATADNSSDICSQNIIFVESGASQNTSLMSKLLIQKNPGDIWGKTFMNKEFGIWVWDSPALMTNDYAEEVIGVAHKNGFNVIYLTIDDYIPVTEIRDDVVRREEKKKYMDQLSVFVVAAQQVGMSVDVVGGAKDWAIKENRWKGYALIDFIKEYNEVYTDAQLRGLQYDVEPYLLTEYDIDKEKILKEYITFIDESTKRMKDVPAKFTVVIPHFYDSKQEWTPSFSYDGEKGYTFTHLLRILDQKQDTSVIIMSYRNFFKEKNGTREISQAEIDEVSESGYRTKIIIAQETGRVSPDYVTFNDFPKISLFDALKEIQDYFSPYENFGGVAVHYFDSFMKLD